MEIKVPFLKEEIGSGDIVKAATSAAGIKPCTPCEARRRRMNAALRFVPQEQRWTQPPAVPDGWVEEASYQASARALKLFQHASGKLIIWHVIEGRYERSHTFCCGAGVRAAAAAKWEELCRLL